MVPSHSWLQTTPFLAMPFRGKTLQFLFDNIHALRPFAGIYLHHMYKQLLKVRKKCGILPLQRGKAKWGQRGIAACEQVMQCCPQTVDIGTRCCLSSAILLWCGIPWRAERDGVFVLPWPE